MKQIFRLALVVIAGLAMAAPRWADPQPGQEHLARARITIYRIAPGKQIEFLRWMATQDEINKEAGIAAVQLYTHINGDDWDFVGIAPVTTPEQDRVADEIAAKRGVKTGLPASLEFRDLVTSHSDTFAAGPMTAAELVAQASK